MIFYCYFAFVFLLTAAVHGMEVPDIPELADAGRVKAPDDPANLQRCENLEYTQAACEKDLQTAISRGFITEGEVRALRYYNAGPIFNLNNELKGWCPCSCFDPIVPLYVKNVHTGQSSWRTIKEVQDNFNSYQVWTLEGTSDLNALKKKPKNMIYAASGEENKLLLELTTAQGNSIGVTDNHRVLRADGKMLAANRIKIGDRVICDGNIESISSISAYMLPKGEKVINVLVDTNRLMGHLLLAKIIVGDIAWENSLRTEEYAIAIRR